MSQLKETEVFVIPYWVFNALKRNNLNNIDIHNYSRVRQVLSIDDVVDWAYTNNCMTMKGLNNHYLSTGSLRQIFEGLTTEQGVELDVLTGARCYSKETEESVVARLEGDGGSGKLYQFIVLGNDIYLVLNEGFMSKQDDPDFIKAFVVSYLKATAKLMSLPRMSQQPLFLNYLKSFLVQ